MERYYQRPIPQREDPKTYKDFAFIDSPLVEISPGPFIEIAMQYPILGFKEAQSRCLLREEVAQKLYRAGESLPDGFKFRLWDAWRPFALQKELYQYYKEDIISRFHLESMEEKSREEFIGKYVANPIEDENLPPGHTTGGAVDLTLVDPQGKELNMGTKFDAFTPKTQTNYYELKEDINEEEKEIRRNRRLLFYVLEEAGFVNLPSEWWHFSYGENSWAFKEKRPALYRGIFALEGHEF